MIHTARSVRTNTKARTKTQMTQRDKKGQKRHERRRDEGAGTKGAGRSPSLLSRPSPPLPFPLANGSWAASRGTGEDRGPSMSPFVFPPPSSLHMQIRKHARACASQNTPIRRHAHTLPLSSLPSSASLSPSSARHSGPEMTTPRHRDTTKATGRGLGTRKSYIINLGGDDGGNPNRGAKKGKTKKKILIVYF